MKPFQPSKETSPLKQKLRQFVRVTMFGLCVGVGLLVAHTLFFDKLTGIFLSRDRMPPQILMEIVNVLDEVLLAPVAAYFCGRMFIEHRWKFVTSLFIGLEIFPIFLSLLNVEVLGIDMIFMIVTLASVIAGGSLSLLTYRRGSILAKGEGKSPEALVTGQTTTAVPMPLSNLDYTAIKASLDAGANASQTSSGGGSAAVEGGSIPPAGADSIPVADRPGSPDNAGATPSDGNGS